MKNKKISRRTFIWDTSLITAGVVSGGIMLNGCAMFAGQRVTAAGHPAESELESFMGEAKFDIQQVYKGGRFPNIVAAVDGTVLALWDGVKVRLSEDGGLKLWLEMDWQRLIRNIRIWR